jgi:ribosomal protein S18 acetylase RimI-like enzyme
VKDDLTVADQSLNPHTGEALKHGVLLGSIERAAAPVANDFDCDLGAWSGPPTITIGRSPSGDPVPTKPVLQPMTEADFVRFKQASVERYARDQVLTGLWPAEAAVDRALTEFELLLPKGLATPRHHVFHIMDPSSDAQVGALWVGLSERSGLREAFVYDVHVHEARRRQGHARRALASFEALAAELGVHSIGLHVFGHNAAARALYASLGFAVTSLNLQKVLPPARA